MMKIFEFPPHIGIIYTPVFSVNREIQPQENRRVMICGDGRPPQVVYDPSVRSPYNVEENDPTHHEQQQIIIDDGVVHMSDHVNNPGQRIVCFDNMAEYYSYHGNA